MIDAAEERSVATCDILYAYIQQKVHMIVKKKMVDLLITANVDKYKPFVRVTKKCDIILYVLLGKALYDCLKSARIFWEHLKKVLKRIGLDPNTYDGCVVNIEIEST